MMIDSNRPGGVPTSVGDDSIDHLQGYEEFPEAFEDAAGTPTSRLVGLGFIGAAIKRRARFWLVFGVLGLVIGGALFVKAKPEYQVTATLLMVNDPSIDQPTAMQTDVLLADNPTFAEQVLGKLGLDETVNTFLQTYTVTDVSNQLMSITVNAPSAADATNRADLLANGYLTFRAGVLQEQLSQEDAASEAQVTKAAAAVSTAQTASQHTTANDYLLTVQQTASADEANRQLTVASMIAGSKVIVSTAPVLAYSRSKTILEYVVGGTFGGAALGMAIIAIGAVTSSRLRRRDDVASALGAPVRLSVVAADEGGRFSRGAGPKRDIRRVVTHLHNCLPKAQRGTSALTVVAVDNQKFVAILVFRVVTACVTDGKRVMVADLSGGALARLLGKKAPGIHTVDKGGGRITLVVPDPEDMAPAGPLADGASSELAAAFAQADVLITLATPDPAVAANYLGSWAADAAVVVTAALSTAEKVQSVGEIIRSDSGVRTVSGVLLGTDRNDESLGL